MSHSQTSGVALVASAAEDDRVTRLVFAWLAAKRSENTRAAHARDIGVAPARRTARAPSCLGWCEAAGVDLVTGVTGLDVARYARQLDVAGLAPASVARKLAAVSGWYDWLAQRGHISSSSAPAWNGPGCTRRVRPRRPSPPDQALALVHAADSVQGPVERAFSQFRQHRAVTARFDKCDFDWRGTIDVASIRIWAPPEPMI